MVLRGTCCGAKPGYEPSSRLGVKSLVYRNEHPILELFTAVGTHL